MRPGVGTEGLGAVAGAAAAGLGGTGFGSGGDEEAAEGLGARFGAGGGEQVSDIFNYSQKIKRTKQLGLEITSKSFDQQSSALQSKSVNRY